MKSSRIALLSAAVLVATSASAQIVQNGSFESFTGTFGFDGDAQLIASSTTLTGWTIVGGEIAILKEPNVYNLTPSDGANFLDLAGYSNTGFPKGITQALTGLSAGQTYTLAMDLGIRNGACVGAGSNCRGPIQVSASIAGASETFTHNSAADGNVWATFSLNFVANDSSAVLTIQGVSLPAFQSVHRSRQCIDHPRPGACIVRSTGGRADNRRGGGAQATRISCSGSAHEHPAIRCVG